MTATAHTTPLQPSRRGRRRWRLALVAFIFSLLALLVAAAGVGLAYERSLDGRILPGVTVGGVALDGLDAAAAEERLLASLPDPTAGELTLAVGEQLHGLSYVDPGRRYDLGPALDAGLGVGRAGDHFERAGDHVRTLLRGTSQDVTVAYDADAVDRTVTQVVAAIEQPLVDARVQLRSGIFVYYSPYAAIDGITLVGRSPGDPPDGTIVVVG